MLKNKKVGVIAWNDKETIIIKEKADVKNIARDYESTELAGIMIGLSIANICKNVFGGKTNNIYNDCKNTIKTVNICKREQCKILTSNNGVLLYNIYKDLKKI